LYSSLQLASPLWELSCHMGAHSVTCQPGRSDIPAFNPAS